MHAHRIVSSALLTVCHQVVAFAAHSLCTHMKTHCLFYLLPLCQHLQALSLSRSCFAAGARVDISIPHIFLSRFSFSLPVKFIIHAFTIFFFTYPDPPAEFYLLIAVSTFFWRSIHHKILFSTSSRLIHRRLHTHWLKTHIIVTNKHLVYMLLTGVRIYQENYVSLFTRGFVCITETRARDPDLVRTSNVLFHFVFLWYSY